MAFAVHVQIHHIYLPLFLVNLLDARKACSKAEYGSNLESDRSLGKSKRRKPASQPQPAKRRNKTKLALLSDSDSASDSGNNELSSPEESNSFDVRENNTGEQESTPFTGMI